VRYGKQWALVRKVGEQSLRVLRLIDRWSQRDAETV
jgi:hypothetical protein